mmetsp:Transcript_9651/g.16213  ORF Transcript_9651/g.16213 Transcript_9651/m.16213 type:complete len:115 (-) Transcript_9651:969-1313(-)
MQNWVDQRVIPGEEKKGPQPIVTFGAGHTYSQLINVVDREGYAIENLPSLPHINVVGSMLTITHGSGHNHQILAALIVEFDMVMADGTLKTFKKGETPFFDHYLLHYGGIGIVT